MNSYKHLSTLIPEFKTQGWVFGHVSYGYGKGTPVLCSRTTTLYLSKELLKAYDKIVKRALADNNWDIIYPKNMNETNRFVKIRIGKYSVQLLPNNQFNEIFKSVAETQRVAKLKEVIFRSLPFPIAKEVVGYI